MTFLYVTHEWACKYRMYFVCISISNVEAFLTLLSFTVGQHMDRKCDISVVVSAFHLAGMHLFIFFVPVFYLKVLCHPCTVPFLSQHPYLLLHVSVTIACYHYCTLSCVVRFYLIWEYMWLVSKWTICEYYQCLPSTAEVTRVPVKYLCCWNLWE